MIYAVRLGMCEEDSFNANISTLEGKLKELELGKDNVVKANWEELKIKGKG